MIDDDGAYILIDRILMKSEGNYSHSLTKDLLEGVYLAPEEWQALKDKEQVGWGEPAAVFAAGLMALEVGLLASP